MLTMVICKKKRETWMKSAPPPKKQEWLTFVTNRTLSAKEERLYQAFKKIDLNSDGKISKDELNKGKQNSLWFLLCSLPL